jgi:hypothetical protein
MDKMVSIPNPNLSYSQYCLSEFWKPIDYYRTDFVSPTEIMITLEGMTCVIKWTELVGMPNDYPMD